MLGVDDGVLVAVAVVALYYISVFAARPDPHWGEFGPDYLGSCAAVLVECLPILFWQLYAQNTISPQLLPQVSFNISCKSLVVHEDH